MRSLIVGTRGSRLALRQTENVLESLRSLHPDASFEVQTIRTSGDVSRASLSEIGGRGVFIVELERALLDGEIDIAVHSLKDLPSEESPGLTIAAIGKRFEPRDALIARDGMTLSALPRSAVVGTGSPRRAVQLLHLRPDLRIADIRGNVDTRLRKVQRGECDAVVLAGAGLARLGWLDRVTEFFAVEVMLPAVGQGALAIETRSEDAGAIAAVRAIDDAETRMAAVAERTFERRLGGGCQAAIAAYAEIAGDELRVRGLVADTRGEEILRGEVRGFAAQAEDLGIKLAERLLEQGAAALLEVK